MGWLEELARRAPEMRDLLRLMEYEPRLVGELVDLYYRDHGGYGSRESARVVLQRVLRRLEDLGLIHRRYRTSVSSRGYTRERVVYLRPQLREYIERASERLVRG